MSEESAAPNAPPPPENSAGGIPSAGKVPIPGASPAGQSVREDDRFAQMRQEIDLLVSIQANAAEPDWRKVAQLGEELLTTLGKDISVASWLAAAFLQQEGAAGVAKGAAVLADLCADYWDTLFPPASRLRARVGAIDWWQDRVDAWLEKERPESLPAALKAEIDASLRLLEESFTAHVPDHSLRLYALRARLQQIPAPPEPEPAAAGAAAAPSASPTPSALDGGRASGAALPAASVPIPAFAPVPDTSNAAAFAADCARFCLDAAEAQLRGDLAHPASYVLRRVALWGFLRDLPPAENGRTLLPAPEDHVLPGLTALLQANEYEKAVRGAESCCSAYIYWLDLSGLSARALSALGPAFAAARLALEGQMAGLLRRFPELPTLCFADGSPFASAATLAWLSSLGASAAPADPFAEAVDKAVAQAPAAALEALGALFIRHPGGKEALRLYQSAFAVCQKGELWPPLPFLAQRLLALSAAHQLRTYDPAAVASALSAAAAALAALLATNPEHPEARTQYARVAEELAGLQPHRLLG
ncbi:MAG: type VI secretion system protein TssA [Candidatus Accumulibacter sp.]|nr:type VI secretion system protein TssA [Accumulibacter sp.]